MKFSKNKCRLEISLIILSQILYKLLVNEDLPQAEVEQIKGCKDKIQKDVVRMARMMKSRHHDGFDPSWFHFDCFFQKGNWVIFLKQTLFLSIRYFLLV